MFDSDSRLMALLNAGSRKIEDAHGEKVHTNGGTGRGQGFLFYRYLIYHHSCLDYGHTLTRLINLNGCLRAYPLVFLARLS